MVYESPWGPNARERWRVREPLGNLGTGAGRYSIVRVHFVDPCVFKMRSGQEATMQDIDMGCVCIRVARIRWGDKTADTAKRDGRCAGGSRG